MNGGWTYQSPIPTNAVSAKGGFFGPDEFFLNNIHVHRISEHTIDGAHAQLEIHFVFMNKKACPWFACNDQPLIGGDASACTPSQLTCTDFCGGACVYGKNTQEALTIMSVNFKEETGAADHSFLTPIVNTILAHQENMRFENHANATHPDLNGFEFIDEAVDFSFLNDAALNHYYHYKVGSPSLHALKSSAG